MPSLVQPTLSDGEITVRPLRRTDIPAIVAACQDPEIPRWTETPSPYTREDAERFLAIAATEAREGVGVALAVTGRDDRLIGTVGLFDLARVPGRGEIGYWTAAPARGRGAASRAVALLRDWATATLGPDADRHPRPSRQRAVPAGRGARRVRRHRRGPRPRRRPDERLLVFIWRAPHRAGNS